MPSQVLRARGGEESPRVTNMELFFDLVYVFAITQLSDFLFHHQTARGALETLDPVQRRVVGVELHRVGDELD